MGVLALTVGLLAVAWVPAGSALIVGVGSEEANATSGAPFKIELAHDQVFAHETAPGQAVSTTFNVTQRDHGIVWDGPASGREIFTHLGQIHLGILPVNHTFNVSAELVPGWTNTVTVGVPPCRAPVFIDPDPLELDDYYNNGTFSPQGQNMSGALKPPHESSFAVPHQWYCPSGAVGLESTLRVYERVNVTITSTPDDSQLHEQVFADFAVDQDTGEVGHWYIDPAGHNHTNEVRAWQRHQFAVHEVDLPVTLTVATDQSVYTSDPTPVTGTVSATFLDASPVAGRDVNLMEFAAVGTSRGERLTLDATGSAAFSIEGDVLGLGADLGLPTYMLTHKQPGEHTVRAELIGAAPENPEATAETMYTVS